MLSKVIGYSLFYAGFLPELDGRMHDWLQKPMVDDAIRDLFGSISDALMADRNDAEHSFRISEQGAFTPVVQECIIFRVCPILVSSRRFLQEVHDELVAALGTVHGRHWHLGSDGQDLFLQVTGPVDVRDPRPYRKRAQVVRMKFGQRFPSPTDR